MEAKPHFRETPSICLTTHHARNDDKADLQRLFDENEPQMATNNALKFERGTRFDITCPVPGSCYIGLDTRLGEMTMCFEAS